MTKLAELADSLRKAKKNGAGKSLFPPSIKKKSGPSRAEMKDALRGMRKAKDDDEALESFMTLHGMMADYDPSEE
jgi:hypothetical protein